MWVALEPFLTPILGIALALGTIGLIFGSDKGRKAFSQAFSNWVGGAFDVILPILSGLEGGLAPMVKGFVDALNSHGRQIGDIVKAPAADLASKAFSDMETKLIGTVSYLPEDSPIMAAGAIGEAFGFGMASHAVSVAFESVFPEKLNTLNAAGPILEKMAGFDEVAAAVREPLYENAFGKNLDYHYKSIFKPEFANERDAVRWHSQRLLSDPDLREVFKYSGLKAKYEDAYVAGAYRAVQPRAIASMIQDTPFPTDQMRNLLEFGGYRDQDIALLMSVMEYNSVKNVRGQYLAALLTAAERGAIDAPTLDSDLDGLNFSTTAKNFVHLTVAVKRLVQLEELYRKSVSIGYRTGQIPDAQYVPLLEAAGIGAPDAQAHYDIDSELVRGKALLAAEREALKEQEKLAALAVATTRELYLKGSIDGISMAAAIAASNIPALLIPSTVGLITAQGLARKVEVYGLLLDPPAAALLKEKVAAVKEQVLKKILTLAAASATLDSFNLPPANRNALLSEWAAQALKTVLPV